MTTGEVTALSTRDPLELMDQADVELAQHVADWEQTPTIGHAVDLVAAAIVLDRPRAAVGAAEYLLRSGDQAGLVATELARSVLAAIEAGYAPTAARSPEEPGKSAAPQATRSVRAQVGAHIHRLRRRLHGDPRNVIAWLDLARNYCRLGQIDQANRAIRAAIALAPDHRFVLRSASRFFLHTGKPDEAHALLRKSVATRSDPWLLAAEIAVSMVAGRTPRQVKSAHALLASGRFRPFQTTELASALATLEVVGGSRKRARRLFTDALRDPTENTVAQVQWAVRNQHTAVELPPDVWQVPRLFEARASLAYWSSAWRDALDAAWGWLDDEPFSGRPVMLGTTVAAAILGQPEEALHLAELGVLANPTDIRLQNNFVFALAAAGQAERAEEELLRATRLTPSGEDHVYFLANVGLVGFLMGDLAVGNGAYQAAVLEAQRLGNKGLEAAALFYWAAAAVRAQRGAPRREPDSRSLAVASQVFKEAAPPRVAELLASAEAAADRVPAEFDLRPARLWLAAAQRPIRGNMPAVSTSHTGLVTSTELRGLVVPFRKGDRSG